MRKIVVPVNFTASAAGAVRYAAELALALEAELHLIHVLQNPGVLTHQPMPGFLFRELRDSAYQLLADLSRDALRLTGNKVPVNTDLEIGDVGSRLKVFCRQCHPFLVVMGAGKPAEEEGFKGGDALHALQQLSYPLLIIPAGVEFHGVREVVIACDEEDIYSALTPALPFLKELNTRLGAHFEVVHVVTNGESVGQALEEYEGWKKESPAFGPVLHIVRQDSIGDGIAYFLSRHPADWLLVLPKKHAFLEFHKSKAKEILPHCALPVMSVHE